MTKFGWTRKVEEDEGLPGLGEYASERDMERFWAEIGPRSEPTGRWWYLPLIALILVVSVPWYLPEGYTGAIVGGFPVWVWITLVCSVAVSVTTAVGALFLWDDDEVGDVGSGASRSGPDGSAGPPADARPAGDERRPPEGG